MATQILQALHLHEGARLWVLVDASGLESGKAAIDDTGFEEFDCLFTGDLSVELRDFAPYLGLLDPHSEHAQTVLDHLIAHDCALIAVHPERTEMSFVQAHRHFRRFNVVYGPDGNALFFRYYDSRVLPSVLEVLEPAQLGALFGPFERFVVPTSAGATATFELIDGELVRSDLPMSPG